MQEQIDYIKNNKEAYIDSVIATIQGYIDNGEGDEILVALKKDLGNDKIHHANMQVGRLKKQLERGGQHE